MGTNYGLVKIDSKASKFHSFRPYVNAEEEKDFNRIFSIFADNKENVWIGTWGEGIMVFNKNNQLLDHFTAKEPSGKVKLGNDLISVIYPDQKSNIWIGTGNGLYVYKKDGSLRNYIARCV